MNYVLGIDIGGTNTKIGLITYEGKVVDHLKFETQAKKDFEGFIEILNNTCLSLLDKHHFSIKDIKAIGVGAPNGNFQNGHIENPPNIKNWGRVNFVQDFEKKIGIPVLLDNDANLAALGEKVWGGAKNTQHFIVVTLGTGLGTGIYSHDELIRGHNGLAAEGGHITIVPNGRPCDCGGIGHLEMYASVKGIKATVKEITGEDLAFREISKRFQDNDPHIILAFNKTADMLALGLSSMANLFGPEKIILAGGVALVGQRFVDEVQIKLNNYLFNPLKNTCTVSVSTISTSDGAILGAAALALHKA